MSNPIAPLKLLLSTLLLSFSTVAHADIKLHSLFSSNMVIQQGKSQAVWGTSDPDEHIHIIITHMNAKGKTFTKTFAKGTPEGTFSFRLPPYKANDQLSIKLSGKNSITLNNILVGEVWICSGQSNMGWSVTRSKNPKAEIAAAKYPRIRLFKVPLKTADTPQKNVNAKWVECSPNNIPNFSAVAYFFGRHLHKNLNIPIGLIQTAWGGTRSEAWTSHKALVKDPTAAPLLKWWDQRIATFDPQKTLARYQKAIARWKSLAAKAKAAGKRAPRRPRPLANPALDRHRPANLYNAMIAPLLGYQFQGAIWYQGESNVSRAKQYKSIFPTMIKNWRKDFNNPNFPFLFVQLAPFRYGRHNPAALAELWEAQLHTLKTLPNTGMAVTTDIGNTRDIHPKNKQDVGKRLALWALAKTYNKPITPSGPIYKSMKVEGSKIRITFDHAKSLKSSNGKSLTHFTIAGDDNQFLTATATIDGSTIIVHNTKVTSPKSVRFAWTDTAKPNLTNQANLPASPFRTDNLPMITRHQVTP